MNRKVKVDKNTYCVNENDIITGVLAPLEWNGGSHIINNIGKNIKDVQRKVEVMLESKKVYVTMTDKFMSGWGQAENRINKLIFECDTLDEANIVADNASNRSDQKHINISSKKPYYNSSRYLAQYKTKEEYPSWYEKDYFRNQK